jgi:hypothetical protein
VLKKTPLGRYGAPDEIAGGRSTWRVILQIS